MEDNKRPTALVTGASGGIGRELALVLARQGYDLLLTARSGDKLLTLQQELAADYGVEAALFPLDLAADGAARQLYSWLTGQGLEIEILVNNAGFGDFGPFAASHWPKQEEMLNLNIRALTELTRLLLPAMLARGHGRILNLASLAAFTPGPLMAVYFASKAYVLSFSEALAEELRGSGVTVTVLCPGPTRTGFEQKAALADSGLFRRLPTAEARTVAEYGYRCLEQGRLIAIPGWSNRLAIAGAKLAPRCLVRPFVRRVME